MVFRLQIIAINDRFMALLLKFLALLLEHLQYRKIL